MQFSRIFGILMIRMSMKSEKNQLENFFRYSSSTPTQKCHYIQMKLAGEAYWWLKYNHIDFRDWLVLQELLHTRYALHLKEPQFNKLIAECKKILTGIMKMLKNKTVEVVEDKPG